MLRHGLGVTGLNAPVMWGSLITTFVFFIGVSHSGTLVSAILFFTRSPLRAAVGRSAEAMTVIAILTAGLYPVIHIGRSWLFFFVLPVPEPARTLAELPLAAHLGRVRHLLVRDGERALPLHGHAARPGAARAAGRRAGAGRSTGCSRSGSRAPTASGACSRRAYPIFAGIVIPLAVSVHSVVSWDFAMTIMPGWHSAIFAPYFVAGAIFSGIAMAILLLGGAAPRLPPGAATSSRRTSICWPS